jgi:cell shape-determining protein MreD
MKIEDYERRLGICLLVGILYRLTDGNLIGLGTLALSIVVALIWTVLERTKTPATD